MNSACSHLQDDWELYALGGLPELEHAAMESHLEAGCKDCRQRYFEAQTALTAMSTLAPMLRPSPKVEQKLMRAIRAERSPATPAWPWWRPAAGCDGGAATSASATRRNPGPLGSGTNSAAE
jgi:anti-sigma factor RsiW